MFSRKELSIWGFNLLLLFLAFLILNREELLCFAGLLLFFFLYFGILFKTAQLQRMDELKFNKKAKCRLRKRKTTPQNVKDKVWNRDSGKCVECGSKENLEFDHIIPVSKGGANTYRNIQLLCEHCNRSKSDNIG